MEAIVSKKIIRVKNNKIHPLEDSLAAEVKIKIIVNNEELISLSATPLHIKELITGFLLTENIIKDNWSPQEIKFYEENKEIKVIISLNGVIGLNKKILTSDWIASFSFIKDLPEKYEDDFKIRIKDLFLLFRDFQKKSKLYKSTGCIHYAGIADLENIIFLAEDIGRHNAVDKVIGYAFLNKFSLRNKVLFISGRISSEMVLKVGKLKIPIIVSKTAPTSLAVELAEKIGLTVIGFLRGNRCNIYTYPYRVIL